jgi:tight adherence protein B
MFFGNDLTLTAVYFLIAAAVGGIAFALLYPLFARDNASKRVDAISSGGKTSAKQSIRSRLVEDAKDSRRKQIQESLNQFGESEKQRKKKLTLKVMLAQTGLDLTMRMFWMCSVISGLLFAVATFAFGLPWYVWIASAVIGLLGFPRWVVKYLRTKRQNVFLTDFADAIDVMVRGLKAGLPVTDAMKVISAEQGPPVGPEFTEIVEGQRVGISVDQGVERMVERMPLPEVQFLAIVMAIQAKTGGNLSEALNNLSKVLRDRKKMKAKIRSVSQEAKSSAMIIGSLPFCIMGALAVLNPDYIKPLLDTNVGNIILIGSGMWMTTGILVMKKMINIDI